MQTSRQLMYVGRLLSVCCGTPFKLTKNSGAMHGKKVIKFEIISSFFFLVLFFHFLLHFHASSVLRFELLLHFTDIWVRKVKKIGTFFSCCRTRRIFETTTKNFSPSTTNSKITVFLFIKFVTTIVTDNEMFKICAHYFIKL